MTVALNGVSIVILSLAFASLGCQYGSEEDPRPEDRLLAALAKEYLSEKLAFYPVDATLAGYDNEDGGLGDFTKERMESRLSRLRDLRQRLLGVDLMELSHPEYIDALLLTNAVKAEIQELDEVASWKRSPGFYCEIIHSGILSLLGERELSEPGTESLLSRLSAIPPFLDTAKSNLGEAPRLWVEEGIADFERCRRLIQELPTALGRDSSPRKLAELGERSRQATRSVQAFISHLEAEVLPVAVPSFALGSESLSRRLLYQEMEDTPLDELRRKGEQTIGETRVQWTEIVARLELAPSPAMLLDEIAGEHLSASELIPFTEEVIRDVRRFAEERDLVGSIPESPFRVVEMPYLVGQKPMSFQNPGPWKNGSSGSVLMLAVPPPEWPPRRTDEHLRLLNTRALRLSVAQALGSHLLQLNLRGSEIRRLLVSRAHREGWESYFQQMLLEMGYEWEDPLMRLMLLRQVLVDQCRLVAAIGLHSEEMSLSDAARLFREEAALDPEQARQEARAVVLEPELMVAAMGSRLIWELREDYIANGGPAAKLRDFHDAFLATGGLPVRLARQAILEDDY